MEHSVCEPILEKGQDCLCSVSLSTNKRTSDQSSSQELITLHISKLTQLETNETINCQSINQPIHESVSRSYKNDESTTRPKNESINESWKLSTNSSLNRRKAHPDLKQLCPDLKQLCPDLEQSCPDLKQSCPDLKESRPDLKQL